jgi:hypothetical protein
MAVDHDISTWPRRSDAAKRLGVSVTQLRRYERFRDQVDADERRRLQAEDAAREGAAEAPSAAGASEAQHNPPDDGREPSGR